MADNSCMPTSVADDRRGGWLAFRQQQAVCRCAPLRPAHSWDRLIFSSVAQKGGGGHEQDRLDPATRCTRTIHAARQRITTQTD